MNRKWSEKTTVEKTADIISAIAFVVWMVTELIGRMNSEKNTEVAGSIALCVVCVCEAISFWNVKRSLSYVAIAGTILISTTMILLAM